MRILALLQSREQCVLIWQNDLLLLMDVLRKDVNVGNTMMRNITRRMIKK